MNVLRKAVDDLKFYIPRPILDTVFVKRAASWRAQSPSLDDQVMNQVIRPRVYTDCNLVGGHEIMVPLLGLDAEEIDQNTVVYTVPKARTQNRTIMTVLNITFTDPTAVVSTGAYSQCGVSATGTAAQALMDSMAPIPAISTATATVIGENTVMIRDITRVPANSYMRCVVAHDEAMSHLQPRSYKAFCKLVEYAVKAFIYNEYIIEMDMAELRGGHNLGKFKDIIENYADANELYDTYLKEKWQKISLMNDRESHTRFIKLNIGGPR